MWKNNKSSTMNFHVHNPPSKILEELNLLIDAEVLEFYKYFVEMNNSLIAEVDDFEILEENGKKFAVFYYFPFDND